MPVDTDHARTKALAKREITRILGTLPLDDQADILADLTIAVEDAEPAPAQKVLRNGAGRPKGAATASGGTRTEKLLGSLKAGNQLSIGDMADMLYGEHEDLPKNRVRSLLGALKKRKLVRRVGAGRWEAVQPKQ